MGRSHFSEVNFWPHNTCLYITDFLGNSPRFVYYVLQTLDLAAYNSGSAQPSLNRNYIYSMRFSLPPRQEQDSIADLLKALDDRIALLVFAVHHQDHPWITVDDETFLRRIGGWDTNRSTGEQELTLAGLLMFG